MSEVEANEAVADANEANIVADNVAAAPPVVPPAAEAEAAAGGGNAAAGPVDNTMFDLSPYFNTLIDTLHRSNDTVQNAAAAAGGTNNNNHALQLRSILVSLLWNGAEQIATAANATSFGQQSQGGLGATTFAVDIIGGQSSSDNDNAPAAAAIASFFPSKFAAVYLYAVAQNIVALEDIVLREASASSQGLEMDLGDGGISTTQVVEIVRVSVVCVIFSGNFACGYDVLV